MGASQGGGTGSPQGPGLPGSPPPPKPGTPPKPDSPEFPQLFARVTTSKGVFRFTMHPKEAPLAVTNFCNLARKQFFDGLPFIARTFVLRLTGRPWNGFDPGYTFRREFSSKLKFDGPGAVGMYKLEDKPETTTHPTLWFATVKEQERWTLDYTLFGTVVEGQGVVDSIQIGDLVTRVEIEGDPSPLFAKYAAQIRAWDEALAKSGWKPGATAPPPNEPAPRAAPQPPGSPPSPPPG